VKKRSKLDISAGVNPDKRQATGFGAVASTADSEPEPEPELQPQPEPKPRKAQQQASAGVSQRTRAKGGEHKGLSPVLIIKTVAVVAVAALSLYELKRRLL
jgi:hypothetical protein